MSRPTIRNFFFLIFSQGVSQFGDKLSQLALVSLVLSFFHTRSALLISVLISMGVIPVVLFSPITGVYIDRWSKRRTMYVCDLVRGLLILAIPLFLMRPSLFPLICMVIFLSSSVGRFFIPAKMAFIPRLVGESRIFFANSLVSVTATIAAVIGTGLGGFLVDVWGASRVFFIDAATFLVSALAIFFIQTKYRINGVLCENDPVVSGDSGDTPSFRRELKDGVRYILSSPDTRYAFRTFIFLFSYVGALFPVYVIYIQGVLGTSTTSVREVGMTSVLLGAGIFVGSLIFGAVADRSDVRKIIDLSVLSGSLFLLFFVVSIRMYPSLAYALVLSFVMGLSISPIFIGVNGLIHKKGEKEILGRVFASLEFIAHLAFLAAMFFFSFLADMLSAFTIILSIGIIGSFFAITFTFKNDSRRRA